MAFPWKRSRRKQRKNRIEHRVLNSRRSVFESLEQRAMLTALSLVDSGTGLLAAFSTGSLTATNDRNSFDVDLLAGDQISAMTSALVDTRLELKNSAGGVLASDTSAGPGNQPFVSDYVVTLSGRYTIDVISENGGGNYTLGVDVGRGLALESDANFSNDSSGNALSFTTTGNTQTAHMAGTIMGADSGPDRDRYQLGVLNAGQTITLATRLPNWSTLEPQVRVLRLNGSTPVYMTDSDPSDGGFSGTADVDGTYYAEVYTTKAVLNGLRYTYNAASQTWTAAEAAAMTAGGHLASVPNQQVQSALVDTFGQSGYWVGLSDAATEGTFVWSDGTPLTYTNWYQGSPANANNTASNDYVYFLTTGGAWYVTSNTDAHASVNEKPAEAGAPALSTAGVNAQYVLDVTVADTVPPVVSSVTPFSQFASSFSISFSEKLTVSTVTASAFDLRSAGADGQFDTADDVLYTLSLVYDNTNNQANFVVTNGPLPNGAYRLKALPSITDLAGNSLGGGSAYTQLFTLTGAGVGDGQVFEGSSNNTYTTATPLTLSADSNNTGWYRSQVGYGSIDPANDQDWWSFTAQAGDHIDVRSGVNGNTSFNPYLALYRDNGTSNPQNVANDTRSGPGLDDYISNYTAPTTGTYYVQLSQYTGTGTYDLRIHLTRGLALESDAGYSNNSSGNALSFTTAGNTSTAHVAGTIMGAENSTPDLDRYQLGVLNAGQTITLATRLPNWTTLEPQVRVLRLNGSTPVYMADSDPSDGSFSGTADIDGTYYAEVYTTKAAVNGTRYTFNSTSQTWTVAEAAAVTAGGHLASVPNQQVQSALVGTFGEYSYWVGLNDAATEGTFVWSDGTPLTYTNWYGGTSSTANNTAANDYVAFDSTGGGWYVSGSGTSYRSVIEKSAEAGAPALSTAGVNAQYVLDVSVADLVPPVVSSVTALPAQGQSTTQLLSSFAVNFSEKLTVSTVTASAFDLRGAGADGQFDTADDVPYTLSLTYDAANNQANFVVANGPMNNGSYRLKILPTITDLAGNALGGGVAYTQTFTVANSVPPGGQVFEGSSNGTYATATPLTLSADSNNTGWYRSQVGYGSIDPSNDQDWWSFTAQAGDHIDVRSGVNGNTSFNPYLALYRDNGTSNPQNVANDTRGGPGLDDYISNYTVPTTGTYYVQLSQYIGTGTYDLRIHLTRGLALESDAGYSNGNYNNANTLPFTTTGNAQHASIAGTIMGSENSTTDLDDYQLGALNAGISITLATRLPNWTTLEPQVRVYRLDGSNNRVYMTDSDPTDGGFNGTADANGNYYAEVYTTKAVLNGVRYAYNPTSQTWTAAEAAAVAAGGHLASVPNQQVQSALVGTFGEYSYWVGLNDAAAEGTFVWSDGTPLTYTNWYGGTSSTANNTAANDYVAFDSTGGGWYVYGSGSSYRSVSEKPAEVGAPTLSTAGVNAQYVLDVTVADMVPPVVSSVTALPAQGQSTTQLLSSFAVNFSEKLTVSTVTASAFDLRAAGPDGQFNTADDITYTLNLTYDSTNNVASLVVSNGPLPDGNYRLQVLPTITDLVGNCAGGRRGLHADVHGGQQRSAGWPGIRG